MEARIDNYSTWVREIDPLKLKIDFEEMLLQSGFGILNFMEHAFEPIGWTGIWLLAESHLAIHTFPEEHKTYIEISSCNKEMYDKFLEIMKAYE
ncbi:MAG: S-adenosylmethionine decarboxylase [Cyclobacteriaceae bacterium]